MGKNKIIKLLGVLLFLIAAALFCLQMGFLFFSGRLQFEYIDNRLFYVINISLVVCAYIGLLLVINLSRNLKIFASCVAVLFVVVQVFLMIQSQKEIQNMTSISPDLKQVFSIKQDLNQKQAIYYRSYYRILARPKERLLDMINGDEEITWLANDVAVFTYETKNNGIQQFVGTYGDRGGGISYYYVGPEMYGEWQGKNYTVISDQEGIQVMANGQVEAFDWENVEQFGTLAVVLKEGRAAKWTIALGEDFEVHADASKPKTGSIRLYKAELNNNHVITLK